MWKDRFVNAYFLHQWKTITLAQIKRTYIDNVTSSRFCPSHIFAVFNGESRQGFMVGNSNVLHEALFLLLGFCSIILLSNLLYTGRKTRLAVCEVEQKMRWTGKEKKWPEILKNIDPWSPSLCSLFIDPLYHHTEPIQQLNWAVPV